MPTDHFDGVVADGYDADAADMFDAAVVDPTVSFLAGLAGNGPALELGIGTGRIALPLTERGVPVHGIDLSPAMVDRLRAKPGGADLTVAIGDFATTRVEGSFTLAYVVFNTILNLTTQYEQVACFHNAAAHLQTGGAFVIEAIVPTFLLLRPGERFRAFKVTPTHLGFDEVDVVEQGGVSHHYFIRDGRVRVFSMPYRYVWPSELDLMAELAGMRLRERWGGWAREAFTAESTSHVSVYEKLR